MLHRVDPATTKVGYPRLWQPRKLPPIPSHHRIEGYQVLQLDLQYGSRWLLSFRGMGRNRHASLTYQVTISIRCPLRRADGRCGAPKSNTNLRSISPEDRSDSVTVIELSFGLIIKDIADEDTSDGAWIASWSRFSSIASVAGTRADVAADTDSIGDRIRCMAAGTAVSVTRPGSDSLTSEP